MRPYVIVDVFTGTRLRPDLTALGSLPGIGVSCFAGSGTRWKTRCFVPALGVPEDPATGSAAGPLAVPLARPGPLAVHLARHGQIAFGQQIEIRQGEEIGRPSVLLARVEVGGSAVIVARGELLA